jgi:NADPH-dependent ferric siderophore reductase
MAEPGGGAMAAPVLAAPARPAKRRHAHVPMRFYRVEVRAVHRLTPHAVRVTFGGPDLAGFADDGPDQRCKLFLPRHDGTAPAVPEDPEWFARLRAMPAADRPVARTYTIRAARPRSAEVDIDFALHVDSHGRDSHGHDSHRHYSRHSTGGPGSGAAGPATRWARTARPGEQAVLWGVRAEYDPPAGAAWHLVAGDDSALPAVAAILERLPARTVAHVVLEIADATARRPLPTAAEATVTWVYRDRRHGGGPHRDAPHGPTGTGSGGGPLLDALRRARLPAGTPYAWVAGETSDVAAVRRHLVRERGVPAESVTFMGYWRRGGSIERTA